MSHNEHDHSSTTTQTRTFITQLFNEVSLDKFGANFSTALSDDLTWTVTGSSPLSGTYHPKSAYISQVLVPLRTVLANMPFPVIDGIYADGDTAIVNWHGREDVKAKNGGDYSIEYAWIMKVAWERDPTTGEDVQKIVSVKGFYDGQKVAKAFEGWDMDELRKGGMQQ